MNMKRMFVRSAVLMLALVMMLTMFSGCGAQEETTDIDAVVDAAVKAALDAAVVPTTITIEADGQQVTITDAGDKSLMQLLDEADINLNDGDILSVSPYETLTGTITVQVLRKNTVVVVVAGEDPLADVMHTAVLMNGTVADAIAAVGIELAENNIVSHELDAALENGMEIIITVEEEEVEEEVEETKPAKSSSSSSGSGNSSSSSSSSRPSSGSSSSGSSTPKPTEPKPTEPKPTEPKPTQPSKTVVSVEIYEDCDGSGHGVKVITYSDGTQEEVPF